MDDTVKSLIRFVARGFYSTQYILVLDALLVHSVLSEDDLTYLLSINRKELRSLCNKLVDDRLIVNHIQKEENFQSRQVTRVYFYIHTTEAIDAIKWKVHSVVSNFKHEMSQFGNPQGYVCPRCGKKVSQLDAISLLSDDKTHFVCDNCGGSLIEDDTNQQATIRQEKLEKLMLQIDPIISYLKKIDDTYIEDNSFESALTKAIPAQSSSTAYYAVSDKVSAKSRSNLTSLQSDASKSQATLHVSITANDENAERERIEKDKRREKLEQNALPSWHSASTVGQQGLGKLDDNDKGSNRDETSVKTEDNSVDRDNENVKIEKEDSKTSSVAGEKSDNNSSNAPSSSDLRDEERKDALAAYYAQLAEREAEEDGDEDEELNDDDFEDLEDL